MAGPPEARPRVSHWLIGLSAIGLIATIGVFAWLYLRGFILYYPARFRGDGVITDSGFWSYPRYKVRLPEVDLSSSGQHKFQLAGLPPVAMTLELDVIDSQTHGDPDALRTMTKDPTQRPSSQTIVSVTLRDGQGKTLCDVSDPLSAWVLSSSINGCSFWHRRLRDVPMRHSEHYTLTISVATPEGDRWKTIVVPSLSGGGHELP